MNGNNKFLNSLKNLGLSERQAKIYSALLEKKDASLTDLQKISGVPYNKVSEVANYLLREGYCSEKKIGNRKYFNIISPKSSFNRALKNMEDNLAESYKLTNEMEKLYNNTDKIKEPFEYIEVFHGNSTINQKFCNLVSNSKNEILSFTKPPWAAVTPEEEKMQGDVQNAYFKRNGTMKTIYEIKSIEDSFIISIMERDRKVGEQSKISTTLPIKMYIFDRNALLIADALPLSLTNELRMVLIKQQTIVNAFIALFDFFWQQSLDLKSWKAQQKNK